MSWWINFQFSLWDSWEMFNAFKWFHEGRFQFSLWDSQPSSFEILLYLQSLSILFMRFAPKGVHSSIGSLGAFNSLYEIPWVKYIPLSLYEEMLSILFMRFLSYRFSNFLNRIFSFNSLYEIPTPKFRRGAAHPEYFQFSLWDSGVPHRLNTWNFYATFNSLYEILEGLAKFFPQAQRRLLSILFMRFLIGSKYSLIFWNCPFNSLYEILLERHGG